MFFPEIFEKFSGFTNIFLKFLFLQNLAEIVTEISQKLVTFNILQTCVRIFLKIIVEFFFKL